jgi:hypothetical protein
MFLMMNEALEELQQGERLRHPGPTAHRMVLRNSGPGKANEKAYLRNR